MLGNLILGQIRRRTRKGKGVDANGKEYNLQSKPYTRLYASQKGQSKVDLTLSGDMLENMHVKGVGEKDVTVAVREEDYGKLRGAEEGILVSTQRTKNGVAKKNSPKRLVKRPFFHLSENDRKQITNSAGFKRIFERALKRLKK